MASWLQWLSRLFLGTPPVAAPPRRAVPVKSAERIRNEQLILDTRRQILAKIDGLRQERAAKATVTEAIDRDTARAAEVVRQMLADLETKGKS